MAEKTTVGSVVERVRSRLGGKSERASWALTPDGRIMTDGAQEATKKRIREVLQASIDDPATVEALGLKLPAAAAAASPSAPADLHALDDAILANALDLFGLLRMKAAIARGYTEVQARILMMSAERRSKYLPLLRKVADKRLPAGLLGEWEDEILLVMTLGSESVLLWREMATKAGKPFDYPADTGIGAATEPAPSVVSGNFGA